MTGLVPNWVRNHRS